MLLNHWNITLCKIYGIHCSERFITLLRFFDVTIAILLLRREPKARSSVLYVGARLFLVLGAYLLALGANGAKRYSLGSGPGLRQDIRGTGPRHLVVWVRPRGKKTCIQFILGLFCLTPCVIQLVDYDRSPLNFQLRLVTAAISGTSLIRVNQRTSRLTLIKRLSC